MIEPVLTGAQMTAADRFTSESLHIPSLVLMERAALAVADAVQETVYKQCPDSAFDTGEKLRASAGRRRRYSVTVIAGRGNNGADGIAAGRILLDRGFDVNFYTTDENAVRPSEDDSSYGTQLRILTAYGTTPFLIREDSLSDPPGKEPPVCVIDALTGTGFHGEPSGRMASALHLIRQFRESGAAVVSVDMPSGVNATTGAVCENAVTADLTVTFGFRKTGQILYPGASHCGALRCADIGITRRALSGSAELLPPAARGSFFTLSPRMAGEFLPARDPAGNKGTFGRILAVAGSEGMAGAALMAARAAYRCGAGMVKIVTPESNRIIVQETLPEALLSTYHSGTTEEDGRRLHDLLKNDLQWADVVLVGPGLGRSETAHRIVEEILRLIREETVRGLVIDADGLRILAERKDLRELLAARPAETGCILTPHPGELAALLQCQIPDLKAFFAAGGSSDGLSDYVLMIRSLCTQLNAVTAAKDARTFVISPEGEATYLNTTGNHGMATAGSGDVLAGMAAAFLALQSTGDRKASGAFDAACAAVCLHGAAGDLAAARTGSRSLMAGDIAEALPELFSEIS